MKEILVASFEAIQHHPEHGFGWESNPSIQKLLNVVSYILANEYVNAVRENPSLFTDDKSVK